MSDIYRWYVSSPSDRAAGLHAMAATVDCPIPPDATDEEINFARERFRQCFAAIWGVPDRLIQVLTDDDLRARHDAEKELGP